MDGDPDFSVVIAAWNSAETIGATLDSLRDQADLREIIVVDDGSTDSTVQAIAAWSREKGRAVRVIEQENAGPSAARNRGAREAAGAYVVFLDADDRLRPDALDRFARGIRQHDFPDMLIAGRIDVLPDGRRRARPRKALSTSAEKNFVRYVGRRDPQIGPGAAAFRTALFDELAFPESLRVAEDSVFYAQVLATRRCAAIADPVVEIGIDERRQIERLRRNARALLESGDALFDPAILPPTLMKYRRLHDGRVQLSLLRAHHRAGAHREARAAWRAALRLAPMRALRWTYLKKLLPRGGTV